MPLPNLVGKTLRHYRIVSLLGQGGMGVVYKAHDPSLDRHVALKVLPPELVEDAERVERFVQEARAASALNHPNVITIHEIGREKIQGAEGAPTVHFISMELVDGPTFREALRGGDLDLKKSLRLLAQVADGLAAAHAAGIVHRDVKPENVMIGSAGYAKILDFGLAKLRGRDRPVTDAQASTAPTAARGTDPGVVLGTVGYMSPEQAQGKAVDHRSDVFSLGCILYEVATGVRPFRGESAVDTLHRIIYAEPESVSRLAPDAPSQLQWILRKALAKDPEERYQGVRDLAIDLRDVVRELESAPRLAGLPGPAENTPAKGRRRRTAALLAASGAVLVVVMASPWLRPPNREADVGTVSPTALSITRITATGKVIGAAISPDGKYVAYVESDQGEQSLWLRQLSGGTTLRLIPDRRVAYWGHTFSNDGAKVIFGVKSDDGPTGAFYEISTLGGAPRKLLEGIDSAPAFSPDGTRMTWVRARHPQPHQSALMVAKADGSDARVLATRQEPEVFAPIFFTAPSWSPDGSLIAAAVVRRGGETSGRVMGVRVETGAEEIIADPGWTWAAQVGWLPKGHGLIAIAQSEQQSEGQVWFVPYPKGTPRSITNDLLDYRIVSLTADGSSLLTVASDARADVWARDAGGRPRKITSSKIDGAYGLSFAPDGRIVYTSVESGTLGIWIMKPDGTDRLPLTSDHNQYSEPVVTAEGSLFSLVRTPSDWEIRRMGLDGAGARVIVRGVLDVPFAVSPDGRWVVYGSLVQGTSRLWRLPAAGGTPQPLTDHEAILPAISLDGSRIAFYHVDPKDRRWRIGVAPLDGSGPTVSLEAEPPYFRSMLGWADADEGLVLNTMPSDRANLWLQPLDGRRPTKLTDFDELDLFRFDVSLDGKNLAMARGSLSRDAVLITGFR